MVQHLHTNLKEAHSRLFNQTELQTSLENQVCKFRESEKAREDLQFILIGLNKQRIEDADRHASELTKLNNKMQEQKQTYD
jgi:predicted RNA binding protein with dsRBD fold (UPF0201 family)